MKIEDFPTEILRLFVLSLGKSDRRNLLFVSRRCHNIALPYLYQSICLPSADETWLNILLLTILRKPQIADEVRELELRGFPTTRTSERPGDQGLLPPQEEDVKSAIARIIPDPQDDDAWIDDIPRHSADTLFAVLLASLPNLSKLTFELPFIEPKDDQGRPICHFYRMIIRAASPEESSTSPPILSHLSSVVAKHNRDDKYCDEELASTMLSPFFQIPSMRHITAFQINDTEGTKWDLEHPSPVTHVDLRDACATNGMQQLISSCKNLQSFTYSHTAREAIHGVPQSLRTALQHAKHSLTTLILDFRSFCDEFDYGVLGESLACFESLKLLHIDAYNLLKFEDNFDQDSEFEYENTEPTVADMLPASMESLHICALEPQHMQQCFAQLVDLVAVAKDKFPVLKEILLTVKVYVDDETRDEVKRACAKAGIECRFTLYCGCFERRWGGKNFSWKK